MQYVDLRPDQVQMVWIQPDAEEPDHWVLAELRAWKLTAGEEAWHGWCSWTVDHMQRIGWVTQGRIKQGVWAG